ncbi:MAG: hypothetical protein WDW38_004842 [Sanguina aurantia]
MLNSYQSHLYAMPATPPFTADCRPQFSGTLLENSVGSPSSLARTGQGSGEFGSAGARGYDQSLVEVHAAEWTSASSRRSAVGGQTRGGETDGGMHCCSSMCCVPAVGVGASVMASSRQVQVSPFSSSSQDGSPALSQDEMPDGGRAALERVYGPVYGRLLQASMQPGPFSCATAAGTDMVTATASATATTAGVTAAGGTKAPGVMGSSSTSSRAGSWAVMLGLAAYWVLLAYLSKGESPANANDSYSLCMVIILLPTIRAALSLQSLAPRLAFAGMGHARHIPQIFEPLLGCSIIGNLLFNHGASLQQSCITLSLPEGDANNGHLWGKVCLPNYFIPLAVYTALLQYNVFTGVGAP